MQGDVSHFSSPTGSFQYLVQAANAHLYESAPHEMLCVIVAGNQNVFRFAKQAGIQKLLLPKSGAVDGWQPRTSLTSPKTISEHPIPSAPLLPTVKENGSTNDFAESKPSKKPMKLK